jgi:hypothetical protein
MAFQPHTCKHRSSLESDCVAWGCTNPSISSSIEENALDEALVPELECHAVLNEIFFTIDPCDTMEK